jgi:DNA repair exonuclease SbcCD ATPase subunit
MHVESVLIQNFKGIDQVSKELNGRSVYVVGGNEAGKTSFISAIFCALTGKNLPPEPIKAGRKTGKVEVELDGGLAVVVDFKKKGKKTEAKLSLYNTETGEELKESPRTRLNGIIGTLDFDPFHFMRLQPKPQLDYFCKAFGVDLGTIEGEYEELNEIIRLDNRELKAIQQQLEPYDDAKAGQDPVDASAVAQEYQEAVEHNSKIDGFADKLETVKAQISDAEDDVKTLEEELARAKAKVAELNEKKEKGEAWLNKAEKVDTTAIKAKLDNLSEENEAIRKAKDQATKHAKAQELEESIENAKEEKVKLMNKKRKAITAKTKGIEGFDFDGEQFTLNGLPFHVEQNNTAAQIIAGLKLGTGLLGDVKIAKFEGSLLDKEHLDEVNKFAEENGLQLFVELVDRENKELRIEFTEENE